MIFLIVGKSGVGKTSIVNCLVKNHTEIGIKPIITYTTRPPREGEIDGTDYHFITEKQFKEYRDTGMFMEYSSYVVDGGDTWYYGSLFSDFEDKKDNRIVVVNPDGIKAITNKLSNYGIRYSVIHITCPNFIRKTRLQKRGDNTGEIKRRLAADNNDFKGIEKYVDHKMICLIGDIETQTNRLIKIINKELGN